MKGRIMKIGIVSDSHKNLDYLNKAITQCLKKGTSALFHLGDDYSDIEEVQEMELIKVPGVYDPEYRLASIPHRLFWEWGRAKFIITHAPESHSNDFPSDESPEELARRRKANFILYGHTHIPSIKEKGGIWWINPGHLKKEDKRGFPASFSFIELEGDQVTVAIFDLMQGEEIFMEKINLKKISK